MNALPDKELLKSNEPEAAFRILYDKYWEDLYVKAIARLGDEDDAHDVLQSVFVSLWRNMHKIEVTDTLAPYLYTALKYAIIKHVYRKAKQGIVLPLSVIESSEKYSTQQDALALKEMKRNINNEVNRLPKRMKEIYQLSKEEQLKNAEIAQLLQISEQTVKNTLTVTLKKLKAKIITNIFI